MNIKVDKALRSFKLQKEPTGFNNPDNVIITGDSSTRTVTLTGTDWKAYYVGTQINELKTGWTSSAHSATTTTAYFLMYDGTDISWHDVATLDPDQFFKELLIAIAFYDSVNSLWVYNRECHGLMPWQTHRQEHRLDGTYRQSGGGLSDYVLDSTTATDRRPSVESTLIFDEDLPTTSALLASDGPYTTTQLVGAGLVNFIRDSLDIVPLSGSRPYWNEFNGSTWQQTLMSNNYFMSVWVGALPTAADTDSQKLRYIFAQGQSESATLLAEQVKDSRDINIGNLQELTPEFVFTNQIILRYQGGNWFIVEVRSLTGSRANQTSSPAGNYLTSVSSDLTLTGLGTTSSPLGIDLTNPNTWTGLQTFSGGIATDTINSFTGTGIIIGDDVNLGSNDLIVDGKSTLSNIEIYDQVFGSVSNSQTVEFQNGWINSFVYDDPFMPALDTNVMQIIGKTSDVRIVLLDSDGSTEALYNFDRTSFWGNIAGDEELTPGLNPDLGTVEEPWKDLYLGNNLYVTGNIFANNFESGSSLALYGQSETEFQVTLYYSDVTQQGGNALTLRLSGKFTGVSNTDYEIEVDGDTTGAETFKWRKDTGGGFGAYTTGVPISNSFADFDEGIKIAFLSTGTTVITIGDAYSFTANTDPTPTLLVDTVNNLVSIGTDLEIDVDSGDITTTGNVHIGLNGLGASATPLDITGGRSDSLMQISLGLYNTTVTANIGGFTIKHRDSTEEDVQGLYAISTSTATEFGWGGGNPNHNAPTSHQFYTAESVSTLSGTSRFAIAANGDLDFKSGEAIFRNDVSIAADNKKLGFGDTTATDLEIYSDGTDGIIDTTGVLNINGLTIDTSGDLISTGTIAGSNLSGTNTGDQTSIVGITGTKAQFNTSLTDGDFAYSGGAFHDGFSDFVANEHIDWTNATDNLLTTGTATLGQTTIEGKQIIDVTDTEALLIRKNGDSGDIMVVDTTNGRLGFNSAADLGITLSAKDGVNRFGDSLLFESGIGASSSTNDVWNGGIFTFLGGDGGESTAGTFSRGGVGGRFLMSGGDGGDASGGIIANIGGLGGNFALSGGDGGSGSDTDGDGGDFILSGGDGENGGDMNLIAGHGENDNGEINFKIRSGFGDVNIAKFVNDFSGLHFVDDNIKIMFGQTNTDLQIYSDGTDGIITTTGNLDINGLAIDTSGNVVSPLSVKVDSASALVVQNAAGSAQTFFVDTLNGVIEVGGEIGPQATTLIGAKKTFPTTISLTRGIFGGTVHTRNAASSIINRGLDFSATFKPSSPAAATTLANQDGAVASCILESEPSESQNVTLTRGKGFASIIQSTAGVGSTGTTNIDDAYNFFASSGISSNGGTMTNLYAFYDEGQSVGTNNFGFYGQTVKNVLVDNCKWLFGDGEDLEVYHDGTDSFIDSNTNHLYINSDDDEVVVRNNGIAKYTYYGTTKSSALLVNSIDRPNAFESWARVNTTWSGNYITGFFGGFHDDNTYYSANANFNDIYGCAGWNLFTSTNARSYDNIWGIYGTSETVASLTVTNLVGGRFNANFSGGAGTFTNAIGVYVGDASGTITNNYGIYVESMSSGSSNTDAIYLAGDNAAGRITIGAGRDLQLSSDGTDGVVATSADLFMNPTGNVKFGTHSTIAAETVTGYITIKDSSGTTRKLAVVS